MVLVLPAQRRKGYAARLLRRRSPSCAPQVSRRCSTRRRPDARSTCGRLPRPLGLQALPVGDRCAGDARTAGGVRSLAETDWPQILAFDAQAFGASRERLLRALATRLPRRRWCGAKARIGSAAFCSGATGTKPASSVRWSSTRRIPTIALIGPALLDAVLAMPLYLDATDHAASLVAWLAARGFVEQRPFTRMVFGTAARPVTPPRSCWLPGPSSARRARSLPRGSPGSALDSPGRRALDVVDVAQVVAFGAQVSTRARRPRRRRSSTSCRRGSAAAAAGSRPRAARRPTRARP